MQVQLIINGAVITVLDTQSAVAADYLNFLNSVVNMLNSNKNDLETEANHSNRTITHGLFDTFGSLPITPTVDHYD